MHLPSTTLAVYVTGRGVEPYVEAVSLRLSGEDKTPAGGPAVELAKRAPKDAPFVMAVVPNESFLFRIPIFESLESVLSWHVPAGETGFAFKTFVKTDDAAKVKGMVSETTMMMAMGKGVLEMLGRTDKRLAPFPKMLESVKIKGEGDTLVAEAELPRMLDSHLGMIVALVSSALNFGR